MKSYFNVSTKDNKDTGSDDKCMIFATFPLLNLEKYMFSK